MKYALLCGLAFLSMTVASQRYLEAHPAGLNREQAHHLEGLYLPHRYAVKFMSFGYSNLMADLLWFKTINYFGKHYASDRDFRWLSHMCEIVSELDPARKHIYEFCATMLAWEARQAEKSVWMLTRAIARFPDDWHLHYQRGFVLMYFLDHQAEARSDFVSASRLPGAETIVMRLAAKQMADADDPEAALGFLQDMLKTAADPVQAKALRKRMLDVRYEADLRTLEQAVSFFRQKQGRSPAGLEELVEAGIINSLPPDPFKGSYFLDSDDDMVKSSSGKKRLGRRERRGQGR